MHPFGFWHNFKIHSIHTAQKSKWQKDSTYNSKAIHCQVCAMCHHCEGKIHGTISKKILGSNGFGYDPIFIPKNHKITFGQMAKSKKIKLDHRFIAFRKLKKKIKIL